MVIKRMEKEKTEKTSETQSPETSQPTKRWLDRPAARKTANILAVVAVLSLLAVAWQRFGLGQARSSPGEKSGAGEKFSSLAPQDINFDLSPLATPASSLAAGIPRAASLDTIIPNRPRTGVITYTVQTGDNLFAIAEKYGLQPETLLWGNFETLNDNPHLLSPGQVLNILPEDGAYYQWQAGDQLAKVAAFFGVDPQAILAYPGNHLDLTQADRPDGGIQPGAWLIVPGGKREIKDWGPPAISRSNPAVASYYGPGSCGEIYSGAIGTESFVWPTTEHYISGYGYSSIHHAIDIGGFLGKPVMATDGGVIVYAGWSNYGYGNLIVIDHGNGWQSAYAHLSDIAVACGQSVFQGGYIGAMGSTGNSSGPHLHFELVYQGSKPNPLDYLP